MLRCKEQRQVHGAGRKDFRMEYVDIGEGPEVA